MFEVYILSTHCSVEISQMAGVLGGICVKQIEKAEGFEQAIANSRLCDCGWTTKQSCSKTCEAINEKQTS